MAELAPLPGDSYRTGDTVQRDADGWYSFVGRSDDVFKSSDYRISPFELESVLIEHPAVAEAAVVPSPDPIRARGAQGVHRAGRRLSAERGACGRNPRSRPDRARPVQAHPPRRILRTAQDDLGQDPPHRASPARSGAQGGGHRRPPDEWSDDTLPSEIEIRFRAE